MEWPLVRRAQGESPRSTSLRKALRSASKRTWNRRVRRGSTLQWRVREPRWRGPCRRWASNRWQGHATGLAERVAARWFALKGVFEHPAGVPGPSAGASGRGADPGAGSVFAGRRGGQDQPGGDTGRALSAQGESVVRPTRLRMACCRLLGARELRAAWCEPFRRLRTRPASDFAGHLRRRGKHCRRAAPECADEEILRNGSGNHRLLLDLSSGSSWLVHRMVNLRPTVLVPITPDMNSVISLQAVERVFAASWTPPAGLCCLITC